MRRLTRRDVLRAGAASTLFPRFTIAGTKSSGRVLGANDTVRVGVAGIHGQGNAHIGVYLGLEGVQVTHLIDPDASLFESRGASVREKGGNAPKCVQDIRQALDDPNLDAISIAAPNHWHSLMTIWACQAGKDVYVEKPLSHNLLEGRRAVQAARRHNRAVQHGTQQRSSQGRAREIAAAQSGRYGELLVSKGYCCKPRWSIGKKPAASPPGHVDFNLWLGPAPEQPYHENLVHYNWHWFWDFGNGDIGNQGVHEMDVARWAIPGATLPTRVWSLGGRFGYEDQGQTPNMQMCVFEFGDKLLVFEVRGLVENNSGFPFKVLNEYHTTEGMIAEGQFHPKNGAKAEPIRGVEAEVQPGGPWGNFLDVVRTRQLERLNADVIHGHFSSALCHLGNISYRLGEQVPFRSLSRSMGENPLVQQTLENLEKNLRGVAVDPNRISWQLGRPLTFDPGTERFTGEFADAANAFVTRPYRKPFVVPDSV